MDRLKSAVSRLEFSFGKIEKDSIIYTVVCIFVVMLSFFSGASTFDIATVLTGIICIVLMGKGKHLCYFFGLINAVLYACTAFSSKYYGEVILNIFYFFPMQFVGWFNWKKNLNQEKKTIIKARLSTKSFLMYLIAMVISVVVYGFFLNDVLNGNMSFFDSTSSSLSIVAMILCVKRCVEQWAGWTLVNIVTLTMWVAAYLNGTASIAMVLMWLVYLVNGIVAFLKWRKEIRTYSDQKDVEEPIGEPIVEKPVV